ncbi:MAG: D-alanyl-D-alanine carboxypeptidase family protein [Clostridia bacterium]|nr:D-alanyl-D-alanine carboxypeptidase family protein [Clostridia bacterium]
MATTQQRGNAPQRKGSAPQRRPASPQRRRKKKPATNYGFIAIAFILVAVILAAVIIALSSNGNENEDTSDVSSDISGNISNDNSSDNSNDVSLNNSDTSDTSDVSAEPEKLNGWKDKDGKKYYYKDGVPCVGFAFVNGVEYYFDESGALMQNAWITVNEKDYYIKGDGKKAVGQFEIDGKNYFFSKTGVNFELANPWNAVCTETQECDVELVTLPKGYGDSVKGKVDKSIYNDLIAMMDDCWKTTGKDVYVISGHRTYNYQANNYKNQVNIFLGEGHSQRDAEILAAEWVAVPGTSEHHLGLAVDIIDTQIWDLVEEQDTLEGQQWLMENCWKYGFILRYPKGTKTETGINYEPWHYRYLGKELAKEVHDSGLTLEKYIESITE